MGVSQFAAAAEPRTTIRMWSGTEIDLLNPDPEKILIDDIAAHLAKINRFIGATAREYTVAEHCLLGLDYCLPGTRLEYLLHDATEAYLGDVTGPLKKTQSMRYYRELEEAWTIAIAERFGLRKKMRSEVHAIDQRMLVTEQRDLLGRQPLSTDKFAPFRMHIPVAAPSQETLRKEFLFCFYAYVGETVGARR